MNYWSSLWWLSADGGALSEIRDSVDLAFIEYLWSDLVDSCFSKASRADSIVTCFRVLIGLLWGMEVLEGDTRKRSP